MKNLFFSFLAIAFLASCGASAGAQSEDGVHFGEKINAKKAVSVKTLLTKIDESTEEQVPLKVSGTIESVCQVKGCWMNLVDDATGEEVFVKFKDYGFFMPLDCSGKKVAMEGYGYKEVVPVDELRHYAEDAGKSAEEIAKITEPEENYRFLANGVVFVK